MSAKKPIIMIGTGEMGGVFARGILKTGYPVYPVNRDMDMQQVAGIIPEPEAVLVTVAEKDIDDVLARIPEPWRDRLILVQNELLPRDWQKHEIRNVTVISVWFEKKPGQDYKVLISSPVYGAHAGLVKDALSKLNIPCHVLDSADDLAFELVLKNVYIVTTNVAGLEAGGTVSQLWRDHEKLARAVAENVMDIQDWLMSKKMDRENLIKGMLEAFAGDPDHKCMGRSAPARLARAIESADEAGLAVHKLREIASQA